MQTLQAPTANRSTIPHGNRERGAAESFSPRIERPPTRARRSFSVRSRVVPRGRPSGRTRVSCFCCKLRRLGVLNNGREAHDRASENQPADVRPERNGRTGRAAPTAPATWSMPEREDEDLLISAGQGDREAFGLLVERHHRAVVQFAYRFLANVDRDTAEDLAQDVFLRAWKSAPSFQPRARVLTWLLRLTTNACLNYQRGRRLRRVISLQPDAPENASEEAARVRSAIVDLPDSQRATITLRHFHDFSYVEIAEVLETSVSAVESLLFRARKTLRGRLADLRNPAESPQVLPELGAESL